MNWLGEFARFAHAQLDERVREAFWSRGVSDEQIELFQLGYMDGRLPELEYPQDFMRWCWEGRRLEDSFVLPLTNALGQVKGLQFRCVDPEKKRYSDYTPLVDEPITFGLVQAMPHIWRTGSMWLVEGVFDMFPIQRVYANVIPALTNRLTSYLVQALKLVHVRDLWLAFDMDENGRAAFKRTRWTYRNDFRVHDVRFPRPPTLNGKGRVKDPSELWEVWGDDRLRAFLYEIGGSDA